MPLTEVAFWLLYFGGVCTAVLYPPVGVLLYILVYHVNPAYQWWGENVRSLGVRTSMTVAVATVLGLLLRRTRPDVLPNGGWRAFPFPVVMMIILALYAAASLTWGATTSERGLYQAEKYIKILVFVVIMIYCVRLPQHYHLVIATWLAGVAYIGYEAWGNVGVHVDGRLAWGLGGPDFAESSDLAVHMTATLPLVGAMFFMTRSWLGRLFVLAVGALAVNTIVLSRSRNALVGLAAMGIAAAFSLPKGYRLKGWVAIGIGALLAVQLADPGWWQRMRTITAYREDAAAMGRLQYWGAAVRMVHDHPLGIGLGNFHETVREYVPGLTIVRSAHNTLLECLAELGWPGFLMLLTIITVLLVQLNAIRRVANHNDCDVPIHVGRWTGRFHLGWHAMALRAALIGYLTCGMFTTRLWAEGLWILMGLVVCLTNVSGYLEVQGRASYVLPDADVTAGFRPEDACEPDTLPDRAAPEVGPQG
ncbi:MAG: O-antigen ligase family protein [Planctomycetes bacterium]|nr:O-antigen ligase family protein [Planctomycetota bacterium]